MIFALLKCFLTEWVADPKHMQADRRNIHDLKIKKVLSDFL